MFSSFPLSSSVAFVLVHLRYLQEVKSMRRIFMARSARYGRVHDEQQQVSLKFAQECILLMFIKAPSVDIGIHQIEESPLRDGLFFIAKSQ